MGKKIDGFVLGLCVAAGFYFFYQRAFESRMLSLPLALLSFFVVKKAYGMLSGLISHLNWAKRRKLRSCAGAAILALAAMPEEEACKRLRALILACYGEEHPLELLQVHPALPLPQQQLFEAWRRRRGTERIVICATCQADAACAKLAASFSAPKVALVDADALCSMIAEHPEGFDFSSKGSACARFRFAHVRDLFFNRKNAPRCILLALCMLCIYAISAKPGYLVCATLLVFAVLASVKRKPRPAKLF